MDPCIWIDCSQCVGGDKILGKILSEMKQFGVSCAIYLMRRKVKMNPHRKSRRLVWLVLISVMVVLALEVYLRSDPNRLDWVDWWFWARQNLRLSLESENYFGLVMSPVQGLFGLSYPVNPFVNPLWGVAALIDSPVNAHKVSSALIFTFYAAIVLTMLAKLCHHWAWIVVGAIICLNLFFNLIPITEIYLIPKSNFNYFQLMPPQNFLMVLALAALLIAITMTPSMRKVGLLLLIGLIAILADPLYSVVYFSSVIVFVGVFYLLQWRRYFREICGIAIGIIGLYFIGIIEFPLLLRESIGRQVFSEYLFHHVKRHDEATFIFQNKQNMLFFFASISVLATHMLRMRDMLSLTALLVQIGFGLFGVLYLATNLNTNFLPMLFTLESSVLPVYVVCTFRAIEQILDDLEWRRVRKTAEGIAATFFGIFLVGKAVTLDFAIENQTQSYVGVERFHLDREGSEEPAGSISFLLGTRGSELSRIGRLQAPFSSGQVVYLQANEHESEFFGTFGISVALITYWADGIATLEENNHLTNPFYLYFFRNAFMRKEDHYLTNWNLFSFPQLHLYPMLGTRLLVADQPFEGAEPVENFGGLVFSRSFRDFNFGQYAPRTVRQVSTAREALSILLNKKFSAQNEVVVFDDSPSLVDVSEFGSSAGNIKTFGKGVAFSGKAEKMGFNILPIVYSNCLKSDQGSRLFRVNLILTGIIFEGDTEDRISFVGPPFSNDCLRKDIEDIKKYHLLDQAYSYPTGIDKPAFAEFLQSPWR